MKAKVGDLIRYGSTNSDGGGMVFTGVGKVLPENRIMLPYIYEGRNKRKRIKLVISEDDCSIPGIECNPIEKVKRKKKR